MAIQGLKTDQQKQEAALWREGQIDAAITYAKGEWKIPAHPEGKTYTLDDHKKAKEEQEANPFYPKVKAIFDATAKIDDTGKAVFKDQATWDASIKDLRDTSQKLMEEGKAPKGFGEIFKDSFANFGHSVRDGIKFDMWNPFGMIAAIPGAIMGALWSAVNDFIKNAAISWGGDAAAPWMKSFEHNNISPVLAQFSGSKDKKPFKPMTTEEAAENLHKQNAGQALMAYLDPQRAEDPKVLNELGKDVARNIEVASQQRAESKSADDKKDPKAAETKAQEQAAAQPKPDGVKGGVTPAAPPPGAVVPPPAATAAKGAPHKGAAPAATVH